MVSEFVGLKKREECADRGKTRPDVSIHGIANKFDREEWGIENEETQEENPRVDGGKLGAARDRSKTFRGIRRGVSTGDKEERGKKWKNIEKDDREKGELRNEDEEQGDLSKRATAPSLRSNPRSIYSFPLIVMLNTIIDSGMENESSLKTRNSFVREQKIVFTAYSSVTILLDRCYNASKTFHRVFSMIRFVSREKRHQTPNGFACILQRDAVEHSKETDVSKVRWRHRGHGELPPWESKRRPPDPLRGDSASPWWFLVS